MKRTIFCLLLVMLPILAAGQPTAEIKWRVSLRPDGNGGSRIEITGESDKPLTEIHGTLEWQSCQDDRCFMPQDTVFSAVRAEALGTRATLGIVRGEAVNEVNGSVERSETAPGADGSAVGAEALGTRATLGIVRGGTVNEVNGGVERSETVPGACRTDSAGCEVRESGAVSGENFWTLILEAILWGLAMLLTPCVFPMVPMTVSFFLKGSENKAKGRFRAAMYGIFIVALYTLPVLAIVAVTRLFGGDTVSADIFNTLSTHWLPNILFFLIFMVFAASFFGAFEFRLPSSWVNGADRKSDGKGLGGVFFMALTLVLVSFSCTGPIVGTVLIKSVQGSLMTPVLVMLAFSFSFALPFVILALFPTLMQKLPKSGSWLGRVKIVLGFIELALGLKFLSVADQAYHWNILGREIYLGLWIVIFTLLGLYLAGVIRFRGEEKLSGFSFGRLSLVIIDFAFVLYLVQGLWGAPLTALSGYLPPMERVGASTVETDATPHSVSSAGGAEALDMEEALALAASTGRNVFLQVSGYACVNCREMDARVLSDPAVKKILDEKYVTVVLYVDDRTELPESEWLTTPSGRVIREVGKRNSFFVMQRFSINSQPSYVLLDADGNRLAPVRGYNLSVPEFVKFLETK